jgi:hypothetical protein
LPPGTLVAEENYLNREFTRTLVLTFQRRNDKGGRIRIKTAHPRYECGDTEDLRFLPVTHEPPPKPQEVAEGISSVRFDTTCNCFQFREQSKVADGGFTGFNGTYSGRACLKLDDGTLSDASIQVERNRRSIGVPCGSDPVKGIATQKDACWTFDISINREDVQCDYHWLIKGLKTPQQAVAWLASMPTTFAAAT